MIALIEFLTLHEVYSILRRPKERRPECIVLP